MLKKNEWTSRMLQLGKQSSDLEIPQETSIYGNVLSRSHIQAHWNGDWRTEICKLKIMLIAEQKFAS